jgi:hypothetical protein
MTANTSLIPASFPIPRQGKISLIVSPRSLLDSLTAMLATLSLRGKVLVIDGGNLFDGYGLARALRQQTHHVQETLNNIQLSRAFTCFQLTSLLEKLPSQDKPVVIFDLLSTFLDEAVAFNKRYSLLANSLGQLQRISALSPVAVWVRVRTEPTAESEQLLTPVMAVAHDIWQFQLQAPAASQLSFF